MWMHVGIAQVDLGVHLDAGLGLPEVRPRKERERQVDGGGVERVDRVVEIEPQILAGIEWPGLVHQAFGEILPDPPVPAFVGVGQRRSGKRIGEAKMIERCGPGIEAGDDVAQAVPRSHLGKDHADELLTESEMTMLRVWFVSGCQTRERLPVNQIQNLREDVTAGIHVPEPSRNLGRSSNPSHPFWLPSHSSAKGRVKFLL